MASTWTKIVPATAVALAAVAWWGLREPAAAPTEGPPAVAVDSEPPHPKHEMHQDEELRREVSALKVKLDQFPAVHSEPVQKASNPPAHFDLDGARETDKAMLITLNETLEREAVDPKWRAEMDERTKGVFAAAGRGTSLLSLDCRTTLCRANVQLDDPEAKANFTRRVSDLLQKGAEGYVYMEGPDDLTLEVFLTREGHRLPAN